MHNSLSKFIAFAAGAAIGSAVTWKLLKTKYEQIAKDEIESVKEAFSNRQSTPVTDDTESESVQYMKNVAEPFAEGLEAGLRVSQLDIRDYAEKLQEMGYTDYSSNSKSTTKPAPKKDKNEGEAPYVIAPEEFDELDGYNTISLTYYADNVLADEYDEIVDDVDDIVGLDSLNHFGDYEEDSVFVRNDARKCDYEILRDPRNFADVVGNSPHRAEDEWDEMT